MAGHLCTKCKEPRDGAHKTYCKACLAAYYRSRRKLVPTYNQRSAEWRRRNPERFARIKRNSDLKREYGIDLEDYERMVALQDGACAICRQASTKLFVDHNHTTGTVRGLLCSNCNFAIGLINDDPERAMALVSYLMVHEEIIPFLQERS